MNTTVLKKALRAFEDAQREATADEKAAKLAWQVARAAKMKLKQVRRLSKLTKKSARKAEDKAERSLEVLELATTKLEKLQKRADKDRRKGKHTKSSKVIHLSRPRAKATVKPRTLPKKPELKRSTRSAVRVGPANRPAAVRASRSRVEPLGPPKAAGATARAAIPQKHEIRESHSTRQAPDISPETTQDTVASGEIENKALLAPTPPPPVAAALPADSDSGAPV